MTKKERKALKRLEQSKKDRESVMRHWFPIMDEAVKVLGDLTAVAAVELLKDWSVEAVAINFQVSKNTIQRLQLARLVEKAPEGFLCYYCDEKQIPRPAK